MPLTATRAAQQGGVEPSWQTTVVDDPGGTTTVVFSAGGGGLLLLMQPDSRANATTKLDRTFIMGFLLQWKFFRHRHC